MKDLYPESSIAQDIALKMQKLSRLLEEQELTAALLFSPRSILYFTGYETPIESGPAPYALIPSALFAARDNAPELFLADSETFVLVPPSLAISPFASYTTDRSLPGLTDLIAMLIGRLKQYQGARIGVEMAETPASMIAAIHHLSGAVESVEISPALSAMRVVKTSRERLLIRAAVHLAGVGQKAAMQHARAGITEIELFGEIHKAMEVAAGVRVPVLADILSGPRTALAGGAPSTRRIEEGDVVLIDLAPRLQGYWGDSCSTFVVGVDSPPHQHLFDGIATVLDGAIARIQPGHCASELHAWMLSEACKLGPAFHHHAGHGLGTSWHEEPRIVPYNEMVLEAGMVIALEPGIYVEGEFGVRTELVVEVMANGVDVLL